MESSGFSVAIAIFTILDVGSTPSALPGAKIRSLQSWDLVRPNAHAEHREIVHQRSIKPKADQAGACPRNPFQSVLWL